MGEYKIIETTKKDTIILEKFEGGVARITLNRPEKRNAWNLQMLTDYFGTLEELKPDDSIKVIISTGAGDVAFTAGRDVSTLRGMMEDPRGDYSGYTDYNIWDRLRLYPKVTIAAVNGFCLGASITFLVDHDIAIASEENAKFGLPEIIRGFVPRTPVSSLFKAIPRKWAFDMTLTGSNFDAQKALQAGLVSRVVPHKQLQDAALELALMMGKYDALVLECCKLGAHASMDLSDFRSAMEMGSNYHWVAQRQKLETATGALKAFEEGKGTRAKF